VLHALKASLGLYGKARCGYCSPTQLPREGEHQCPIGKNGIESYRLAAFDTCGLWKVNLYSIFDACEALLRHTKFSFIGTLLLHFEVVCWLSRVTVT
jgi:hypothetical protein